MRKTRQINDAAARGLGTSKTSNRLAFFERLCRGLRIGGQLRVAGGGGRGDHGGVSPGDVAALWCCGSSPQSEYGVGSSGASDVAIEHAGLCPFAEGPAGARPTAPAGAAVGTSVEVNGVDVVVDRVAGLDIGKDSVTVCVRVTGTGARRVSETRTYSTMTRQIQRMADWLDECGVELAAMESTATYWKPVFYCLEEHTETWLLNAAHIKAVPGRKSDVRDSEWIARLVEHGLVSPSFVPPPEIRRLRNLTRYRLQLTGDRTREATRVEKLLEDASIKLSAVVSNIAGVSARDMLYALVAGERDPAVLADLAQKRLRVKIPALTESLTGHFDDHHALLIGGMLERLRQAEASLAQADAQILAEITLAARVRTAADDAGDRAEDRADLHRRDRRGHVPVPDRRAPGGLGRGRALGA